MSEIILLRTNAFDDAADAFVTHLRESSGRQVVVAADESDGQLEVPSHLSKVSVRPASLQLFEHPNFGWRCGDYFLYAAQKEFPHTDYFWLIEPDVRIHTERSETFFNGFGQQPASDFVTPWFVRSSPAWVWYKTIAPYYPTVNNCMLQLCRFSKRAVQDLLVRRQSLTKHFLRQQIEAELWPNDEAFVGAAIEAGGLSTQTFAEFNRVFSTRETFTFTQPTSEHWLKTVPLNDCIYHPVVAGAKFNSRMKTFLSNPPFASEADLLIVRKLLNEQAAFET